MTFRSRSWVIDFNRFSHVSGKAQVRRATLSCDSSYDDFFFQFLHAVEQKMLYTMRNRDYQSIVSQSDKLAYAKFM